MKILLVTNSAWNLWNFRRSLIERLSSEGYDIICAAPADGFEWHLSEFPRVQFIPLQFLSRKSIFRFDNVRLFFEISQLMQREQPDVSMFFTIKPNVLGVMAARWNRIPAISTIEGRGISATSQHWLRALSVILYRLAFRFVHRAIFINSDDYNDFIRYRIIVPEQAVLTNGPGVDVQHFSPRPRRGRSTGFSFLFPARLLSEKGIREYAEAAAILKKQGLNARFQIIGNTDSGNPTTITEGELQKWVGEGRVEYIGFTD
ncbi:MAG: glycosyltransferase, partial [Saprospiraceae bacterium]|nr:glycosyltransferase [Saprospiraceae bacterium]